MKQTDKNPTAPRGVRALFFLLAAVLLLGGVIALVLLLGQGGSVALSTPHHQVDRGMLSYFYYDYYHAQLEENGDLLAARGFDSGKPAAEQVYEEGRTWQDYFMDGTVDYVRRILVFAETATREGGDIAAYDTAADDYLASLADTAAEEGKSLAAYITDRYHTGEEEVRRAVRLSAYGLARYEKLAATTYTSAELEAAYLASPSDYRAVDYILFPVQVDLNGLTEKDAIRDAYLAAESAAHHLADADSESIFASRVKERIRAENPDFPSYKVEHLLSDAYVYHENPAGEDDLYTWLQDPGRLPGDTAVFGETGDYRVVFFLAAHDRVTYRPAHMRHVLFSYADYITLNDARAMAEGTLADFIAGGKQESDFLSLVTEYSADSDTLTSGGLYENIQYGDMEKSLCDWLLDDARQEGDATVVATALGYHLVWHGGYSSHAVWEAQATVALQNATYNQLLTASGLVIYDSALTL